MPRPLSIYIHWPFCKSKCPYCDFNSHVRDRVEHDRWRAGLLAELEGYKPLLQDSEVVSVFFGGGTPSLMEPQTAGAVIERIMALWDVSPEVEITLEANPTSVEAGKLRQFRDLGINRASLGVQALSGADLSFLGRQHSPQEALAAVELAAQVFPNYSFDLIYARPGQSLEAWEAELTQALAHTRGHMSLYQLTIEQNTAFYAAHARGELPVLDDDTAADMYELTQRIMEAQGMPAYEISNHAKPGWESRHNLAYWRGDDTIGIGPGAHGRYRYTGGTSLRSCTAGLPADRGSFFSTENIKSPERWLELTEEGQGRQIARRMISPGERAEEMVMMGLRLRGGILWDDWLARTGLNLRHSINVEQVDLLVKAGLLEIDQTGIRATPRGRLMLSSVTGRLLA